MIILPNMKSSIYKIRTLTFKILVGGSFSGYNGNVQNQIIRLNSNGIRDTSFIIGDGFSYDYASVEKIAIQSDGKIVVGGYFTSYNGTPQNYITRLNSDGTRDTSFTVGTGFDGLVYAIAVQSDGKILVGGSYSTFNGTSQNGIVRLNSDGTRDTSFVIGTGFNGPVSTIAIQSDGKILVGGGHGGYSTFNGTSQNGIVRLNSDGTLDTGFTFVTGFFSEIHAVAVQSDGKILIGGDFIILDEFGNLLHARIARLNFDGSRDTSFTMGGFNERVYTIAIQSDGKIVVGGGESYGYITRLNADSTIDTSFVIGTGFDQTVKVIAIQPDGQILVGGNFTSYNETGGQQMFTRLNSDGTINEFPTWAFNEGSVNTIVIV
jgi:uncharacterized delta-60 repeat protein